MLIARHEGSFQDPLLVGDAASKEDFAAWEHDADQVAAGATLLAIRVQHEVDGPAEVNVWDQGETPAGVRAFAGSIQVDSGRLWVGDLLLRHGVTVPVPSGPVRVVVILADPPWSARVDLVVAPVGPGEG
jgi:hypothetical protein